MYWKSPRLDRLDFRQGEERRLISRTPAGNQAYRLEGLVLDTQLKVSLLKQATRGLVVNRINGLETGKAIQLLANILSRGRNCTCNSHLCQLNK